LESGERRLFFPNYVLVTLHIPVVKAPSLLNADSEGRLGKT
jgi:hypothetical protein